MPDYIDHSAFNEDPVYYCNKCLSLKVRHEDCIDADWCADCGCTDISETTIKEWEKLYESRYSKKYTEKGTDISKSIVFNMSIDRLKAEVIKSPKWYSIIKSVYPWPPKRLSKVELVMWFFDKAVKDRMMDTVRTQISKYLNY